MDNSIDPEILFDLKCICNVIGMAINICVAATIIRRRRARCKPRNIFLLAILLSYLLFFTPDLIEVIHQGLNSVESVCHLHFAITGVPQVLLLSNMFLALTDRYLAINYPEWYQEKMTVRLACTIIVIGTIVIVFFLKIDYILQLGTLRCEDWLVHANVIGTIVILLFVSCVVLNGIVYLEIKIPRFETTSPSDSFNEDSVGWIELTPVERDESHRPVDVNANLLNPVEMEATRTLIVAVTYFLPYQTVVIVSGFWVCRFVFGELECANLKWMGPCVRELTLIPAFYGPLIIFLMKNQEIVTDEIGPV
jgi:dopamine receptor D1